MGGRCPIKSVVFTLLELYGTQALYLLKTENGDQLLQLYNLAGKYPKTRTMATFGLQGYTLNGPLQGKENVIVCFAADATPGLLKRLDNRDEIERMRNLEAKLEEIGETHPNVTTFHMFPRKGVSCSSACMVMPMYPATLTSFHLYKCTTSIEIWPKFLRHMISALSWIHGFGFCHGDIKPSNIAINNAGEFVLIDLGSMCEERSMTESTELFLPVEEPIIYGLSSATRLKDLWMLAVTVCVKLRTDEEMITKRMTKTAIIAFLKNDAIFSSLVGLLEHDVPSA
jgi:hypothetical protein